MAEPLVVNYWRTFVDGGHSQLFHPIDSALDRSRRRLPAQGRQRLQHRLCAIPLDGRLVVLPVDGNADNHSK
jgi:hypothetical protein